MKKPKKVKAPEGCSAYLTPGKIYDVIGFWTDVYTERLGHGFIITNDIKTKIECNERCSNHLNNQNWIIIETEPITYPHPPDPSIDYGEPGRPDSTCAECGQVWLKEDFNQTCTCPVCRPVEELNEIDEKFWGKMTAGCEKSHREREERNG